MQTQANTTFRLAETDDAALVRGIVWAAYSRWVAVIGREPLPMSADYGKAILARSVTLLAVDAACVGLIETYMRPGHLWIENVAVQPEEQGKGYGRLLLGHADDLARAAGLGQVRLLTNEAFASNIALYGKTGFAIDRTEPFMGGTTVHMSKRVG